MGVHNTSLSGPNGELLVAEPGFVMEVRCEGGHELLIGNTGLIALVGDGLTRFAVYESSGFDAAFCAPEGGLARVIGAAFRPVWLVYADPPLSYVKDLERRHEGWLKLEHPSVFVFRDRPSAELICDIADACNAPG